MPGFLFHARRQLLSHGIEQLLRFQSRRLERRDCDRPEPAEQPAPENPLTPEDFRPLEDSCFQYPYDFYRLLRDDYPVYQLPNGIFCVSRYEDIVEVSRNNDVFSSTHQGIVAGLQPGQNIEWAGAKMAAMANMGVVPADVLALSDPPKHTNERKIGHKGLNARFVKSLEPVVEELCVGMMDEFIDKGSVEFMQEFGWRLPMRLIIKLLGFSDDDYERVKTWCMHGIASQSGITTPAELTRSRAETMAFMRYCWKQYLRCKAKPRDDLCGMFVGFAEDPENPFTPQLAVSAIFQLLIAGSDSSATSMGNALKMLVENPQLADEIRADMDKKLPAFVEEVFRLESAFQGHFRWVKDDTELQGVKLPRGSRVFLMWASGNRDERVFEQPDEMDLNRPNGKKHLTFGHGIHACIGRELARSEIRIVLREFLTRTCNLRIDGEAPFIASMFARTLVQLPVSFDKVDVDQRGVAEQAACSATRYNRGFSVQGNVL